MRELTVLTTYVLKNILLAYASLASPSKQWNIMLLFWALETQQINKTK